MSLREPSLLKGTARIANAMAYAGGGILLAMMLLTFFDVAGRSVLNRPIIGSVEMLMLMMGLLLFLGLGRTTCRGGHIRVDVLTRVLPVRLQRYLDVIVHGFSLFVCAAICWRLWETALEQTDEMNVTQNLELPVWLVALLIAIFSLMLFVAMFAELLKAWLRLRQREE